MHLATFARKRGFEIRDWSESWNSGAAERGWKCLAVFSDENDCEPDMLLIRSPRWDGYQVRDIASGIPSGKMLSEATVKNWMKQQRQAVKKQGTTYA